MSIAAGLDDASGRYAQLGQEVFGKVWRVRLAGDGAGHALHPGGAVGFVDWPLGMERRDGNRSVAFAEQTRATQPAAEKTGQFVARQLQVFGVHGANHCGLWPLIHQRVKVIGQALQAVDTAGGLVGRVADAVSRGLAHQQCSEKSAIVTMPRLLQVWGVASQASGAHTCVRRS